MWIQNKVAQLECTIGYANNFHDLQPFNFMNWGYQQQQNNSDKVFIFNYQYQKKSAAEIFDPRAVSTQNDSVCHRI